MTVHTPTPRTVLAAAALVGVEGAVSVAYAVYLAVRAVGDAPAESVAGVEIGALLVLLLGVALLAAARGLARLRGWARGPVVTVQLLTLLTAVSFLPAAGPPFVTGSAVALVLAVAVLVLLFRRGSRDAFAAAAAG